VRDRRPTTVLRVRSHWTRVTNVMRACW